MGSGSGVKGEGERVWLKSGSGVEGKGEKWQ